MNAFLSISLFKGLFESFWNGTVFSLDLSSCPFPNFMMQKLQQIQKLTECQKNFTENFD